MSATNLIGFVHVQWTEH